MIYQEEFTCADSTLLGAAYTELGRQPLLGFIVLALEVSVVLILCVVRVGQQPVGSFGKVPCEQVSMLGADRWSCHLCNTQELSLRRS